MKNVDVQYGQKEQFNAVAIHPLQAYEWGEFRAKTGVTVVRHGIEKDGKLIEGVQLTIHPVPHTPFSIGYYPKGKLPTADILSEVARIGKAHNCIFVQFEPAVEEDATTAETLQNLHLIPSAHPLFTKYNFVFDLTKSEDELLQHMHPKTRYNIKIAQKHTVQIVEDARDEAFEQYWRLMEETTGRQGFYAHSKRYHQLMWETLKPKMENGKWKMENNHVQAHLFLAKYKPEGQTQEKILTAWVLFSFHDTLYYPYGSSSSQHRKVMASTLMMWEAIKFGRKLGLKHFDMWGALGPNPNPSDPWYGFHQFKERFAPRHVTYVGSYDLVLNPLAYHLYKVADKARWPLLRLLKSLSKK